MIKVIEDGKNVYLGLGFEDRSDSFDLNSTLHDYFKGLLVSRNLDKPADCRLLFVILRLRRRSSRRRRLPQRSWTLL